MKKTLSLIVALFGLVICVDASTDCGPRCSPPYERSKIMGQMVENPLIQSNSKPCKSGKQSKRGSKTREFKPSIKCETHRPCKPCKTCCEETPKIGEPCNCAYNAPARIDPACGRDVWLNLSFIYWQAKEDDLHLGRKLISYNGEQEVREYQIDMNFDYYPGFKVGGGFSFCSDDWTLFIEYVTLKTHEQIKEEASETANESDQLFTPWLSGINDIDTPYSYLQGKWSLSYNVINLELGRPCYIGKKLILKPQFGLKGGWIDQKYKVQGITLTAPADLYSDNTLKTWLIGPRAGLETDWLIGCNFRTFGNVAGALTYQNFKLNIEEAGSYYFENEKSRLTPNAEFALGLGYGKYFFNRAWYFDLTVSYDFFIFWNQNMLGSLDSTSGNLYLHGLTAAVRLDF